MDTIKKARLHRKVATSIFFESSGGQQHKEASLAEIRLAVAEPGLEIGNIETVLETLQTSCYFLTSQNNRYRFSLTPNLNKLLSDRRANIKQPRIEERVRAEAQKIFAQQAGVERVYFPERTNQVSDRAAMTLVVLAPDQGIAETATLAFIEQVTRECGGSGRTYKSALIWSIPESAASLDDEARTLILTAEEAKKCIEPPALKSIEIRPENATVEPGKNLTLTARGLDQHGQEYPLDGLHWSTTGGEITEEGVFRAGDGEGEFTVTATSGGTKSTVRLRVKRPASAKDTNIEDTPDRPPEKLTIDWTGRVPHQKWMNFYTKVLARFATSDALVLRVQVSVNPPDGVTPQQVEEFKSALRELGLDVPYEN